jgi:ATPase subunit of ABC transporter with duplicated ATPase domains
MIRYKKFRVARRLSAATLQRATRQRIFHNEERSMQQRISFKRVKMSRRQIQKSFISHCNVKTSFQPLHRYALWNGQNSLQLNKLSSRYTVTVNIYKQFIFSITKKNNISLISRNGVTATQLIETKQLISRSTGRNGVTVRGTLASLLYIHHLNTIGGQRTKIDSAFPRCGGAAKRPQTTKSCYSVTAKRLKTREKGY